jgi:NIPSNAP
LNATKLAEGGAYDYARGVICSFRCSWRKSEAQGLWEEIAVFYGCSVVELRQYTLHGGSRERLIQLFEDEFIESQEALEISVIGPFCDLDDANRFVWLRGFPDMNERGRMLSAFYDGPVWRAHRDAANATMIDSDNVLLLRPIHGGAGNSAEANGLDMGSFRRDVLVVVNIHYVDGSAIESFGQFFEKVMCPVLTSTGARIIAAFESEAATNTFSRLPVREGETVFVWLAVFRDAGHFEEHAACLRNSPDWRKDAPQDVLRQFARKAEVLKLAPTPRSQLRH